MKKISVIGAGTMGHGIAHHLALFDFEIVLVDISKDQLKRASTTIIQNMERQVKKGVISATQKEKAFANINFTPNLNDTSDSQLFIEAAAENFEVKAEILKNIDSIAAKDALVATNTSSISITRLASNISQPSRFIGMHFMNPVPVMKLVEIINGYATDQETTQRVSILAERINKVPVIVNDYPGFVSNRVLMPMINEAIGTLHEGVAGVKEIDTIMKLGMAHPMGPLQLADYIGLDVCLSILNVLYDGFGSPKYAPCPLLVNMVYAGRLGVKSGEGFYDYNYSRTEPAVSKSFSK